MTEYTPTTERLRTEYVQMRTEHYGFADLYAAEFDRWLDEHDRQVVDLVAERLLARAIVDTPEIVREVSDEH